MFKTIMLALAFLAVSVSFTIESRAQGIDPDYPAKISNQNIWSTFQQYQIMLEEIRLSLTKRGAGALSHDIDRWKSYISHLRAYWAYWQAQAFLDWPVTHGRVYEVGDPLDVECEFKDNISACELSALVISARDEFILSDSADDPMHAQEPDYIRQQSYWTAMEGYMDFMLANSPLDEPVTAAEERLGLKPGFDQTAP